MESQLSNPFSVTKATDFTDQEIAEYWVDFFQNREDDITQYLNTNEAIPKYILGGKGCGKTHLLRYYSFPLQRLRNNENINRVLEQEGYIGINVDLGAMNSARMLGCGIDEEQWDAIFGYYIELFVGINLISILETIFKYLAIESSKEEELILDIKRKFCLKDNFEFDNTINGFRRFITHLKKEVDFQVNNAALRRRIDAGDLSIKLSPGDLFFEIPRLLSNEIPEFKDVKFIFILDQLETLLEYQKIYLNTLVWDKRLPSTFWVGARTHGFTTRKIKSGEFLKNGSEFREIYLDEIMREDDGRYKEFAIALCAKRIKSIINLESEKDDEKLRRTINEYYEEFSDQRLFDGLAARKELPHQKNFKNKVKEGIAGGLLNVEDKLHDGRAIFEKYIADDTPILEKYKIFHFYKCWTKTTDLKSILESLATETAHFKAGRPSKLTGYEEKYKLDFLAQLIFENNLKIYHYSGLDSFIKVSSNNPRALLVILKEIFERSKLNQEDPFVRKNGITVKTQSLGIYYASKWFYEDIEAHGDDGKYLYRCVNNLATVLQGIRFSDKPTETSPSSFSYKPEKASEQASKFIYLSKLHRVLIPVKGRHDKNSERVEESYQINRMLAPFFNLPISRRGIVPLNASFIESIFNPSQHSNFQSLFDDFIQKMTAPFGEQSNDNNSLQASQAKIF